MLEPEDFADLHEMLPIKTSVTVFAREANSVLATSGVEVGSAEKRPVSTAEERMLSEISGELDRCTFHLWTVTFSRPLKVRSNFVIEEPDGTKWAVVKADLELAGARWRCPCIEYLGRSVH